jgi:hypothetical protein
MSLNPKKDPNKHFVMRLKKGEAPLRILLSPKDRVVSSNVTGPGSGSTTGHKQIMHRHSDEEHIIPKKKQDFINFYDMGQIKDDDTWQDTDFQVSNTPNFGPSNEIYPEPINPTVTEYDARNVSLFAIPTANWTTAFRKITKGALSSKYHISANFGAHSGELDTLPEWTSGGLKVSQADLDSGLSVIDVYSPLGYGGIFNQVTLLASDSVKVTASPSYAAADAGFSPVPKMDVFLPPALVFLKGLGRDNSVFDNQYAYGILWMTLPRFFPLNEAQVTGGETITSPGSGLPPGNDFTPEFVEALDNWETYVTGRAYYYDEDTPWEAGSYPPPAIPRQGNLSVFAEQSVTIAANGQLLAVVKKGSDFYYFWRTGVV